MWFDIHTHGKCPVCGAELAVISITEPNQPTKEEKMEYDKNADLQDALDRANAHIKRLQFPDITHENEITSLKNEINALESSASYQRPQLNKALTCREELIEYLTENYDDMGDHASNIAEIFGITLTRQATFNVVMNAQVTINVPLSDVDTVEDFIIENLTVQSSTSDIEIEDYNVETVEEH